jgi:hypothetical protein
MRYVRGGVFITGIKLCGKEAVNRSAIQLFLIAEESD